MIIETLIVNSSSSGISEIWFAFLVFYNINADIEDFVQFQFIKENQNF